MSDSFVNIYESEGEQWHGWFYRMRSEAEKEGREGLPDCRRVALVRVRETPVSGLRRPKYEDMGQGRV